VAGIAFCFTGCAAQPHIVDPVEKGAPHRRVQTELPTLPQPRKPRVPRLRHDTEWTTPAPRSTRPGSGAVKPPPLPPPSLPGQEGMLPKCPPGRRKCPHWEDIE
jgi:hypothetical protein